MQRRHAQVYFLGQIIDAQRLFVVAVEPLDRLTDAMALTVGDSDFIQPMALLAAQQPIENFPTDQRREHGDVFRRVEQTCQAQYGVEHRGIQPFDIQPAPGRPGGHADWAGVGDQRGNFRRVDVQAHGEDRFIGRDVHHSTTQGHRNRDHQVIQRIVIEELIGQPNFLAALRHDAQRRLREDRGELVVLAMT
ncbi:hypothetical protein D3C71_1206670 [compost metagenome]